MSSLDALRKPVGLNTPTVSVVVPCYGRGDLLGECLRSLRAQVFRDWEAIVVDDGTPSTEVERTVMAIGDPRIHYVRLPRNRGLAAARNTGFRQARASLVLPLDSDDGLHPAFLQRTTDVFRKDPSLDCVYTDFQWFGNREVVRPWSVESLEDMLRFQWIPGPGTLQRRTIWESVGGYCEPPAMTQECEWDFWIGASVLGLNVVHIPEPLYLYRVHPNTMSAGALCRESKQREAIYRRHKATIDRLDSGSKFRAAGYLNSATGYLRIDRRARATWLALRGLRFDAKNRELRRLLAIAVLPGFVVKRLQARHIAKAVKAQRGMVAD